jgi:hypothetical protein
LNPTAHVRPTDHIYFNLPRDGVEIIPIDLHAPADSRIVRIFKHVFGTDVDYELTFQTCAEVRLSLDHVMLTESTPEAIEDVAESETFDIAFPDGSGVWFVDIPVEAGEVLGETRGLHGVTMSLTDTRVTADYANPARYEVPPRMIELFSEVLLLTPAQAALLPQVIPASLHAMCLYDYFTTDVKTTLSFADIDGEPKSVTQLCGQADQPSCGLANQDLAGTAQGNWYLWGVGQSALDESGIVALVHHPIDPEIPIFSFGDNAALEGLDAGAYKFSPDCCDTSCPTENLDFPQVTPGTVYCYDGLVPAFGSSTSTGGSILLTMPTASRLRVEYRPSVGCTSTSFSCALSESIYQCDGFSCAAKEFVR